jgi:hypothetical protein
MTKRTNVPAKPRRMRLELRSYIKGDFAEDKDWAAAFREGAIRKTLTEGDYIILDFDGISLTTQSFIHALISDILRASGEEVLDESSSKIVLLL